MGRSKVLGGKTQIIEAATTIIDRDGEDSLSIRNLSKELGVAPMTIYNYLKNIDDIKREVLIMHFNETNKQLLTRLSGDEHREYSRIERYVTIYVDIYYELSLAHPELIRFIYSTGYARFSNDAELRHFLRPLEVFYDSKKDKETRMAYHMCEELIYMMIRNQAEKRDVITKEEMEYRVRFIVNRMLG